MDADDLIEAGRNDAERRFLARLTALQPPFCDAWTMLPQLVVTVTVVDREENLVLRTLRVDFDGDGIVAGNDPSHQINYELEPDDPDRMVSPAGLSPEELADAAMAWFRAQAQRPIERREWDVQGGCFQHWVLADTGHGLVWGMTAGVPQGAGGPWRELIARRPPDRVVKLPE